MNYGSLDFLQAKASVSGALFSQKLAGRLSFSGTQRNGTITNVRTGSKVNDLDNAGLRGSLLFVPTERVVITAAVDHTRQRPQGYTQVVAGVAPTLRAANRQWAQIASDLNYAPPSYNAFERVTDVDSPLRSYQDSVVRRSLSTVLSAAGVSPPRRHGGYWHWDRSNDRGFHRPADHHRVGGAFRRSRASGQSGSPVRGGALNGPQRGRSRVFGAFRQSAQTIESVRGRQVQGAAAGARAARRRQRRTAATPATCSTG